MCELLPKAEFYILTFDCREQFEFAVFTAWKGHTCMIRKINSGSMYIYRSITTIKKSPVLGLIGDYFKLQKLDKKSPPPHYKVQWALSIQGFIYVFATIWEWPLKLPATGNMQFYWGWSLNCAFRETSDGVGGGAEGPSWHLYLSAAFCPRPLHILQGGSMTWGVENFVSQGALNMFHDF